MVPWYGWAGFVGFLVAVLALDVAVFHRKAREVHSREALAWSALFVGVALAFGGVIALTLGGRRAGEYLTGYVIEWSLSVDNIFVFVLLLSEFAVPSALRHNVLLWGVLGAVVLRLGFILGGATLLHRFEWVPYVFGAVLLVSAARFATEGDRKRSFGNSRTMRLLRRAVPVTEAYEGPAFLVRRNGRTFATPLLAVLALLVVTDVVFAVDSIPAIFAVTQDAFVAFSANALAVLGLRPLYFVLADAVERFRYLRVSLAAILGFVGAKMVLHEVVRIPTGVSLAAVVGLLGAGIGASWIRGRVAGRRGRGRPGPARPEEAR